MMRASYDARKVKIIMVERIVFQQFPNLFPFYRSKSESSHTFDCLYKTSMK